MNCTDHNGDEAVYPSLERTRTSEDEEVEEEEVDSRVVSCCHVAIERMRVDVQYRRCNRRIVAMDRVVVERWMDEYQ